MRTLLCILTLFMFACEKEDMPDISPDITDTTASYKISQQQKINVQIKLSTYFPYDTVKFTWIDINNHKHINYVERCLTIYTKYYDGDTIKMLIENGCSPVSLFVVTDDTLLNERYNKDIKVTANVKVK